MNDEMIIPSSDEIIPYTPRGKTLRLKKDNSKVDFHKTIGDIFRCMDTANIIKNIRHGIEYVVQVPTELQEGLNAGKYNILTGKDGRQWATLYEVLPDGKHSFVGNMPIKAEKVLQGNPMHDISLNMQMMALQQQLAILTELVQNVYDAVIRVEKGQKDDRIGRLLAGKKGIEQAITIKDKEQRKIAIGNAQQLLLESWGQIGTTLKTKVNDFPAIPKSQVKQFIGRLASRDYFSGCDEAFDSIQEYFQLFLTATQLLADSYYYINENNAAKKVYQDAIELVKNLDFTKVKTLQHIHPNEDFSDTVCERAVPYIKTEQEKSLELSKPYDTIELLIDGTDIVEVLENGE